MEKNKLIDTLVSDLTPVQVKKPARFAALAIAVSISVTFIETSLFFKIRGDVASSQFSILMFSILFSLALAILGFFAVSFSATPGRKESKTLLVVSGLFLLGFIATLFTWPNQGLSSDSFSAECFASSVFLSFVSFAALFIAVKNLAPAYPGRIGALCGGVSACVGMSMLGTVCENENPLHLAISHFVLPVLVMSLIGMLIGKKLLRW